MHRSRNYPVAGLGSHSLLVRPQDVRSFHTASSLLPAAYSSLCPGEGQPTHLVVGEAEK